MPAVSSPETQSASDAADWVTELLWEDSLHHLEATNAEILLPVNVMDVIGKNNVDKIKARLR
jgi:hypothetical protein